MRITCLDYALQFDILFEGFEKRLQRQLEYHLAKNLCLQTTAAVNNIYSDSIVVIYICNINRFDNTINKIERLKTTVEYVICAGDFIDFESLIACVREGCYGCVSLLNIHEEIIPALLSVLEKRVYISPVFSSIINNYFIDNNDNNACRKLCTQTEYKLIRLLTTGALYKEIAWKMQISENTVRSHVRNIYAKLKVHSKTELTQKIFSGKLITSAICLITDYIACLCYC